MVYFMLLFGLGFTTLHINFTKKSNMGKDEENGLTHNKANYG